MRKASVVAIAAILMATGLARADEKKSPEPPKPAPEVEKLGYFVGDWTSSGELVEGPMGPGGKTAGRDRCQWMAGNFFVACNMGSHGPLGDVTGLAVLGWDAARKVYTWWSFNSVGEAEAATGTLAGDTWTWSNDVTMGGKTVKSRYVIFNTSADGYNFRWESSEDGKTWKIVLRGTVMRAIEKKY